MVTSISAPLASRFLSWPSTTPPRSYLPTPEPQNSLKHWRRSHSRSLSRVRFGDDQYVRTTSASPAQSGAATPIRRWILAAVTALLYLRETRSRGAPLGARCETHRGAHRRRHLDGLGDPGLPRPAGRVDQESGGREDVEHSLLPRRCRGAQSLVAEPARESRLAGHAQSRAPRDCRARAAGQAACAH